MTWQMAVIAAYRVVGSLPVLRWPLAGAILAMVVDLCDLFLMDWLGGISNYQSFDKYCDLVYMITFLVVALRWEAVPRTIAVSLFAYRMVGFTVFEITSSREVLLIFPNVFEFWFVFVAATKHFKVDFAYTPAQLIVWGFALTGAKLVQEYILHYARLLDSFTAFQAVDAIWHFLTSLSR